MIHYRCYEYKCVCGLWVKGFYPLTAEEFALQQSSIEPEANRLDPERAVCRMVRGVPSQGRSTRKTGHLTAKSVVEHTVGCGRTLAQSQRDAIGEPL